MLALWIKPGIFDGCIAVASYGKSCFVMLTLTQPPDSLHMQQYKSALRIELEGIEEHRLHEETLEWIALLRSTCLLMKPRFNSLDLDI